MSQPPDNSAPPPLPSVVVQAPQPPPPMASSRMAPGAGGFSQVPPPGVVTFAPTSVTNAPPLPPPSAHNPQSYAPPPPPPADIAPPAPLPPAPTPAEMMAKVEAVAKAKEQEELQRKLMEGQEPTTISQQENMSIKGQSARHLVMQKLMRTQAQSGVILLRNMVGPEDCDEDLEDEISEECSKFGKVGRVIIYQERQSEEEDAEILVKIFVEFNDPNDAKSAKNALHGRFFGGRVVNCDIYDQDLFHHGDLSG